MLEKTRDVVMLLDLIYDGRNLQKLHAARRAPGKTPESHPSKRSLLAGVLRTFTYGYPQCRASGWVDEGSAQRGAGGWVKTLGIQTLKHVVAHAPSVSTFPRSQTTPQTKEPNV